MILGQDVNDIFPVEIDRYDKLSLFRSCINNQLIVAGSITEELPRVAQPGYGQPGHGPLHVPVISSHKAHVSCTVGQNSEFYQYQLSKYPIVQCHSARISPSDTAWLDRMCPPDFAILPKVCQDCINHKCLNCKSKLMLSPKQRYEEEMLTKSISFVEDPKPNGAFGHFEISKTIVHNYTRHFMLYVCGKFHEDPYTPSLKTSLRNTLLRTKKQYK